VNREDSYWHTSTYKETNQQGDETGFGGMGYPVVVLELAVVKVADNCFLQI